MLSQLSSWHDYMVIIWILGIHSVLHHEVFISKITSISYPNLLENSTMGHANTEHQKDVSATKIQQRVMHDTRIYHVKWKDIVLLYPVMSHGTRTTGHV